MVRKLKVVRVVTASFIVPWHLGNMLRRMPKDFEVCVVGQNVSTNARSYPGIVWFDIDINRKISPVADLLALISLCRLFLKYKPDVVHSVMHKAALLSALAGFLCRVPVRINTFTGQYWATKSGIPRLVYYASDWLVNFLSTVCMTDSVSQSNFLYERGIRKGGRPLPVLAKGSLAGVDLDRFNAALLEGRASDLRARLGLTSGDFVFIYLARKAQHKGAIDVLRAFSIVRRSHASAKLLYVGPDESEGKLDWLRMSEPALFLGVIDISGAVDGHEVYLAASDVLCLPSYMEGFGSIVIEAAALGLPAIGTCIPGLVDAIEDGHTGVLVPPGDLEQLSGAMRELIENPARRREMSASAAERTTTYFSADAVYEALKACYLDLVAEREE